MRTKGFSLGISEGGAAPRFKYASGESLEQPLNYGGFTGPFILGFSVKKFLIKCYASAGDNDSRIQSKLKKTWYIMFWSQYIRK